MTRLPSSPSALRSPNPHRPLLAAVAGLAVAIAAFVAPQAATAAPLNGGPAVLQEGQRPVCTGKTALVVGDSRNGTTLTLRVDNAFVSSDNRYIVTVDGVYAAETYRGTVYYSWTVDAGACNKNLLVTVPRLHAGSKILVFQSSGQPGQAIRNIGTLYSSTSR